MFCLNSLLLTLTLFLSDANGKTQSANDEKLDPYLSKYGQEPIQPFSGITTFAHLPHQSCLQNTSSTFDIAILGAPFDSTVSYRPGARFGPYAIRAGSRRQIPKTTFSAPLKIDPYSIDHERTILDCGDVPMNPFDPALALDQLEKAYSALLRRKTTLLGRTTIGKLAKDGIDHPRIITAGGDHTIVLPILRSLSKIYGPISVIHFDAHLDTWSPKGTRKAPTPQAELTHGTFFHFAKEESLLGPSIHLGIRTRLGDFRDDYEHDLEVGFELISTEDLDDELMGGVDGIVERVRKRVGERPVYLSFDIDVCDPAFAPGTGTPESGGWTAREVKRILRKFVGLNIVGADLVEVAPAYDNQGEITSILAGDLIFEFLSIIVKTDLEYAPGEISREKKTRDEL